MFDIVDDVLYFLDKGFIRTHHISVAFEGRESCISADFIDELDLQLQINETEID